MKWKQMKRKRKVNKKILILYNKWWISSLAVEYFLEYIYLEKTEDTEEKSEENKQKEEEEKVCLWYGCFIIK